MCYLIDEVSRRFNVGVSIFLTEKVLASLTQVWPVSIPESRDENENLVTEKNQLNLQLTAFTEEKEKLVEGESWVGSVSDIISGYVIVNILKN